MELGCVSMNASKPCNTLFRSRLLDDWYNLNVKKVRVSLFKNSLQVLNLLFDGRDSGYMDWFSPGRVLESPWNDLYIDRTYNIFSVPGSDQRYFFINSYYNYCPGDTGWLAVVDKSYRQESVSMGKLCESRYPLQQLKRGSHLAVAAPLRRTR
ncbi:uncharacterized protein LOC112572273 [Pomacea canaliculata]|uniref:uncharacterized protein LOC112572273 n=1 Tax=Pomacea canaliculata TaxID=400727 RepID=UPI000D72E844|nr:uncharacterized protein LOC112572273 [Pomacea canaliculata]